MGPGHNYGADLGRFVVKDPIRLEDWYNLYAYVLNNPVNMVDPLGLWRASFSFGFGGTVGVGWKKDFIAVAGSAHFAFNYDSNKGFYKSINFQLVEFEEFSGFYFGGGPQLAETLVPVAPKRDGIPQQWIMIAVD